MNSKRAATEISADCKWQTENDNNCVIDSCTPDIKLVPLKIATVCLSLNNNIILL